MIINDRYWGIQFKLYDRFIMHYVHKKQNRAKWILCDSPIKQTDSTANEQIQVIGLPLSATAFLFPEIVSKTPCVPRYNRLYT